MKQDEVSKSYSFPKSYVSYRKPRIVSTEQRERAQAEAEILDTQDTDYIHETETFVETDNTVDYSEYFQGISGCAVLYDELSNTYSYYNKEKCETEVSPLSTFKIVSALAGLENDVLENEETTMEYSSTKYPIDTWNSNLTLEEAFENSCVWYFRKVVDIVGQENIQSMLAELQYGNRDISEWNGSNVNSLPELNGFWLESSLKISTLQQVNVLNYIFSGENNFSPESIETLKHIMYLSEFKNGSLYGKTGIGTSGEAWFMVYPVSSALGKMIQWGSFHFDSLSYIFTDGFWWFGFVAHFLFFWLGEEVEHYGQGHKKADRETDY